MATQKQIIDDACDELFGPIKKAYENLFDHFEQLQAENKELHDTLYELVDIVQGHLDGDCEIDSFTLQPAENLLKKSKA